MSKPMSNPFFETDFTKFADLSKFTDLTKMMGDFKMPTFNFEALMSVQRRNIEAITAVNQAAFESWQGLVRRQSEIVRQSVEEASATMNAIMTSPTAEEKVMRQAEASKVAVEKCLAQARDIAETVSKVNTRAMETVASRLNESLDELRGIMKTDQAA